MLRKDMSPYIAERLLFFKKHYEGITQAKHVFPDREDQNKIELGDFEFRFDYRFYQENSTAYFDIKITPLTTEANKKLESKFESKINTKKIRLDNLTLNEIKIINKSRKIYDFKTELVTISDKRTYESVFEHLVKPLILEK